MNQYLLIFHHFPLPADGQPSVAELDAVNQQWQAYIGGLASQGKFASTYRIEQAGRFVGPDGSQTDVVADGKPLIVGNLTLQANSLDEAVGLTAGCPILAIGGTVEVRPLAAFECEISLFCRYGKPATGFPYRLIVNSKNRSLC